MIYMTVFLKHVDNSWCCCMHFVSPFTILPLHPCTNSCQVNWPYQWIVSLPEMQFVVLRSPSETVELYVIICVPSSVLGFCQYFSVKEL